MRNEEAFVSQFKKNWLILLPFIEKECIIIENESAMEADMQELSKKILDEYQVRKTRQQKDEFIELLQRELPEHKIIIEEGGFCKNRNIIVGDFENSKYILGAHYDTAPVIPFPNFLTPKNPLAYLLYIFLIAGAFLVIELVLQFIILRLTDNLSLMLIGDLALLFFILGWVFAGKENKHTANDNTSGVITLIEALHDEQIKDKVCCVFFDNEETGLFGSSFFVKKHKKELKDKFLFNFDCVSDGDTIMMIISKSARKEEEVLKASFRSDEQKKFFFTKASTTLYPSDQMNFKHYVGVAAFKRNKIFGYYIDRIHTKKDVIFEEKNIEMIVNGIRNFVEE